MPSKNPAQRLRDVVDNIEAIWTFTSGMDLRSFSADRKTIYAVVRALEIVSEASRRLPEDFKDAHAEIDWWAIAAAGNIYRHEYEAVDDQMLWNTAKNSLKPLHTVCEAELLRVRP